MHWNPMEILELFHLLPHAHHDLLAHEDKALVAAGAPGIIRSAGTPPAVSIEKSIDPAIDRSAHNMGLLIRDYVRRLPGYISQTEQAEALMQHWRKLLLEQPERLAQAQLSSWNSARSRHFWHERLRHLTSDHFPEAMDADRIESWERSAGTPQLPTRAQGIVKTRQWQELVLRQRLHTLDLDNRGIKR
jgi:hypothetical protein